MDLGKRDRIRLSIMTLNPPVFFILLSSRVYFPRMDRPHASRLPRVAPPKGALPPQASLIARSPPNPTIQPRTPHLKLSLSYLPTGCFARGCVRHLHRTAFVAVQVRTEGVTSLIASRLPHTTNSPLVAERGVEIYRLITNCRL